MQSVNPATGEVLKRFDEPSDAEVEKKLSLAAKAFERHRRTPFAERAAAMRRAGDLLEKEKVRWGTLMTQEMGKTLKSAVGEAEKCAWVCRFYADNAERFLAAEVLASPPTRS